MIINTPISLGELLDKISILLIKKRKIQDVHKLKFISEELELLERTLNSSLKDNSNVKKYLDELIEVNLKLWEVEDQIRKCERNRKYDQEFINLARSVYFTNDERSKIKLKINEKFGSTIIEVKSYEKY